MIEALLGMSLIFVLLVAVEFLWRKRRLRGERARKLIHIAVGVFVAFWPWFMPLVEIQAISLTMLIIILFSRRFNVLKGIHSVRRRTIGDILYPVTIALVAGVADSRWIFAAAMLHLGLADGLAAVVGDRIGKKNRYKVLGEVKSIAGSLTFFVVSMVIMALVILAAPNEFGGFYLPLLTLLPVAATCIENLSVRGTDNIFVPLFVALMLNQVAELNRLLY